MAWERIRDRKKIRRAEATLGTAIAALWAYKADDPSTTTVHTRAFATLDGRHGWIYTDGHIDWDDRQLPPWAD